MCFDLATVYRHRPKEPNRCLSYTRWLRRQKKNRRANEADRDFPSEVCLGSLSLRAIGGDWIDWLLIAPGESCLTVKRVRAE